MLYRYKELLKIKKYCSSDKINKAISNKELYKLDCGLYSDSEDYSELEYVVKKYPNGVFNGESAFYIHGLTDYIPDCYYIATKKKAKKIKDNRIVQTFMEDKYHDIGVIQMKYQGVKIRIYDKERMLIELVRNKNTMPYDMYKEIINNYRQIVDSINLVKVQEYLSNFKYKNKFLKIIQEEVL